MTFGAYARHRGVSQPRVSQMVAGGRLDGALVRVGSRTLIRPEAADELWPRRAGNGHDGAAGPPLAVIAGGRAGTAAGNGHGVVSRAEADRRRAVAQAEKEELELARRRGAQVDVAEVVRELEGHVREMASRLEAVPWRLQGPLGLTREQALAIEAEIQGARSGFADWLETLAAQAEASADG